MNKPDLADARKHVCIWSDICPEDDNCDCDTCPHFTPYKGGQATEQYEQDEATKRWLEWLRDWRDFYYEEEEE